MRLLPQFEVCVCGCQLAGKLQFAPYSHSPSALAGPVPAVRKPPAVLT